MNQQEKQHLEESGHWIAVAQLDEFEFNMDLEPHVLTDKTKAKALPCRVCQRPCIVTTFASPAKTACHDHRDRHAAIDVVHEVKKDLEPHVLTDKAETKEVPCRHCGRPCIVTLFASAAKVACLDCRKTAPRPRKTTQYVDNGEGRLVAQTTIAVSRADLQWSEWTLGQPFHFDRIYIGDERERIDKARAARLEAHNKIKANKRLIADPKAKIDVDALEQENVELEETMRVESAEQTRLARVAWVRGAIAANYRIEKRERHRVLVCREYDLIIPDDYLEPEDFKQATLRSKVAA